MEGFPTIQTMWSNFAKTFGFHSIEFFNDKFV